MSYKTAREVLYHIGNYMYLTQILYVVSYKISYNIPYIYPTSRKTSYFTILKYFPQFPVVT